MKICNDNNKNSIMMVHFKYLLASSNALPLEWLIYDHTCGWASVVAVKLPMYYCLRNCGTDNEPTQENSR